MRGAADCRSAQYGFDYGLPTAAGGDRARIEGDRNELRARGDHTFGNGALRYVRAEGTAQWYTHDEIEESGAIGTTFNLRTQTGSVTAKTRLGRLDGALGAQGLFRQYEARGRGGVDAGRRHDERWSVPLPGAAAR